MNRNTQSDTFEQQWASLPEDKLELIDGKLIISTLAGSRRILRELLNDYGPELVLPMASQDLWWKALRDAYDPQPQPQSSTEWWAWASDVAYEPDIPPAGPRGTDRHWRIYTILRHGLHYLGEMSGLGRQLGRDFVIRLGEDGLTPDVIFIDQHDLKRLYERYQDGAPTIAVEVVMEGSEAQDRILKRRLYEQAEVPEYWLVEPKVLKITFYQLQPNGLYKAQIFDLKDVQRIIETKEDQVYHSSAVPGLSLSLMNLWGMDGHDWKTPWQPFLAVESATGERQRTLGRKDGIGWDEVPFAPRVDLKPVPIRFAEFVSWCGRAKFERYGGGMKIDGTEGTRRAAGMLLMTFGLIEVVKLAPPREWVVFLDRGTYQPTVQQYTDVILPRAKYKRNKSILRKDEIYYHGGIPQLPDVDGYGDTLEACQQDLMKAVEDWVLLKIARREEIPELV